MTTSIPLQEAIQALLLPVSKTCLRAAADAAANVLLSARIPATEHVAALHREWLKWTLEDERSALLGKLVKAILSAEEALPPRFVREYFRTYDKLRGERYLPPAQARSLLGNTLLIQDLLTQKMMSCTQVARVLSVTQSDHAFNWAMVQPIARALGSVPQLDQSACNAVYDEDMRLEGERFADASPTQAIEIVADIGDALGYDGSLYDDLNAFYEDYKPGYGIMLHVGCLVLEFYDHPPKEAPYEFEPRGALANDLAERFHQGYSAASSPYLNNAKGAANLDTEWAWARQPGYIGSALAFAALLERIGSMPYPARKQLAPWIRQWLHRISREQENTLTRVELVGNEEILRFLEAVTTENTRTRGVLDQRFVDLLAVALHGDWDSRGVGDFVNASNVRKRKTGDVEFLEPQKGVIVAYEAHGGGLADVYVDLHRQTLRQVLIARKEELTLGRDSSDWVITIRFIAHALGDTEESQEVIEGFPVKWEFLSYKDFLKETSTRVGVDKLVENFDEYVVNPINSRFVPEHVRERFRNLSA